MFVPTFINIYVYARLKYILIRFPLNSSERIICGTFYLALGCDQFEYTLRIMNCVPCSPNRVLTRQMK